MNAPATRTRRSVALALVSSALAWTPLAAQTEIHRFQAGPTGYELGHRVAGAGDLDGDGIEWPTAITHRY